MIGVNIIGKETYKKKCPFENRWDLDVSENQAEKIANGVKDGCINLRLVQGKFIQSDKSDDSEWFGDNLGRIAEGLSKGLIQLQPEETTKQLSEKRSWCEIPTKNAKGWKNIFVTYVYLEKPSLILDAQAKENPKRVLFEAATLFPGQYVGVTKDLNVLIGDDQEAVIRFIKDEKDVNEIIEP